MMEGSFFRMGALAVAAILLFVGRVSGQGCDQGILNYTITCDTAPHGVVDASRCSNQPLLKLRHRGWTLLLLLPRFG